MVKLFPKQFSLSKVLSINIKFMTLSFQAAKQIMIEADEDVPTSIKKAESYNQDIMNSFKNPTKSKICWKKILPLMIS